MSVTIPLRKKAEYTTLGVLAGFIAGGLTIAIWATWTGVC